MDVLFAFIFFILGLLIGSFLNVVILRHGYHESKRARSGCMACEKPLRWYELLPVISYVALRGKCSGCGSRISIQYPAVELITGTLFAVTFVYSLPLSTTFHIISLIGLLLFWSFFIVLVVYDMYHTLVPTTFAYGLIIAAVIVRVGEALLFQGIAPLVDAGTGAFIFGGFLLLIVLFTRGRGMGAGDIYIAVALGLLFGVVRGIEVLLLSFWIGAFVGVVGIVLSSLYRKVIQKKEGTWFTMGIEVPFVPFLFLASLLGAYTYFSPLTFISSFVIPL